MNNTRVWCFNASTLNKALATANLSDENKAKFIRFLNDSEILYHDYEDVTLKEGGFDEIENN